VVRKVDQYLTEVAKPVAEAVLTCLSATTVLKIWRTWRTVVAVVTAAKEATAVEVRV
jgi:hypothetical protein